MTTLLSPDRRAAQKARQVNTPKFETVSHSFYALPTTDFFSLLKECVGAVSLAGLMFKPLTNTKTCVFFLKKRSEKIQDIGSTTLR